jgi:hypothetical protein
MPRYFDSEDYETDLQAVADGLFAIASAIKLLGNADAVTPMGAFETLGKVVKEGFETLASSIDSVGYSIDTFGPITVTTYNGGDHHKRYLEGVSVPLFPSEP